MSSDDVTDVGELLNRYGSNHGLRVPLPDRNPPLSMERCAALELAIFRADFMRSAQGILLTILKHTDWRSHVCYHSRAFLVEQSGSGYSSMEHGD